MNKEHSELPSFRARQTGFELAIRFQDANSHVSYQPSKIYECLNTLKIQA